MYPTLEEFKENFVLKNNDLDTQIGKALERAKRDLRRYLGSTVVVGLEQTLDPDAPEYVVPTQEQVYMQEDCKDALLYFAMANLLRALKRVQTDGFTVGENTGLKTLIETSTLKSLLNDSDAFWEMAEEMISCYKGRSKVRFSTIGVSNE